VQKYIDENSIKNVILITNESNMGAGYSRNRGLDIANGKYLLFLDGDDYFELDMIEKLYLKCEEFEADVAICDFYCLDNETKVVTKYISPQSYPLYDEVFNLSDIHKIAFQYMNEIAWNKLFRRSFINDNNIRFQCQHNANDQYFVFASMLKANRIVKIEEPLLTYRVNVKNHLSTSINKDPKCIWKATKATLDYILNNGEYDLYKKSFNSYAVNRLIFSLVKIDGKQRKELLDFYKDEGFKELKLIDCEVDDFIVPSDYAKLKWLVDSNYMEVLKGPYYRKFDCCLKENDYLINELMKKNVVIWGAGKNGEAIVKEISKFNVAIKNVIDISEEKVGKMINDYIAINDKSSLDNGDFVVATNPTHIPMILYEANKQGKNIEILDARAYLCFENSLSFSQAVLRCN
jgi:glycosyltransferase involved in cell wall biosynthesis